MDLNELIERMKNKKKIDSLVTEITNNPLMISSILTIINTEKGTIKYTGTKLIRLVSEIKPAVVYPYFDDIFELIYHSNSFIKWDAITIISNLIIADDHSKFDLFFNEYFNLLHDQQMITAANVVRNAWKIVKAKPEYEPEITKLMLMISNIIYYNDGEVSPECNAILCGHVIDCFSKYFEISKLQNKMIEFAYNQTKSTRKALANKAIAFLRQNSNF